MMDEIALRVLLNDRVRALQQAREKPQRQRYRQARAVKGSVGKHAKDTWNKIAPMKVYLCQTVREQLQALIERDNAMDYEERRKHGDTL
jgi:hypothetical protein